MEDNIANESRIVPEAHIVSTTGFLDDVVSFVKANEFKIIVWALSLVSVVTFYYFWANGLGLAYNDARSHLDIGRRTVDGMKTGLAQLGSVWLPLPHFLMILSIWNDFMWHSGLSGAIFSMIAYVATGVFIWKILQKLGIGTAGRLVGVFIYGANANILYLQSTAMTELLFLLTFSAFCYELICWYKSDNPWDLVKSSFWIMLATLARYEGWFIFLVAAGLITVTTFFKKGFKESEGVLFLFSVLGGLGILLWLTWNYLIFGDPLFSFFGPYSAHAQQQQIYEVGELITKFNIKNSANIYWLAMYYTVGLFSLLAAFCGIVVMFIDKRLTKSVKLAIVTILLAPLVYNILALYLGHSIISIAHVFGDNWFNVRYGATMVPSVAIFVGYFVSKVNFPMRLVIVPILVLVALKSFFIDIPVTIQDALWGASSKNVSQVSAWLKKNASANDDKIFISAGSHDAIIFSSGFDMDKFVHEGTGLYWKKAGEEPDKWVRYIVMRTYDMRDATYFAVADTEGFGKYDLILKGEFADIYELKGEYRYQLPGPKAFIGSENLNKLEKQKGTFLGKNIHQQVSANAGVVGITSMFSVVSAALLLSRIEKPKFKRVRVKRIKVDGELGVNVRSIRSERKGLLSSDPGTRQ